MQESKRRPRKHSSLGIVTAAMGALGNPDYYDALVSDAEKAAVKRLKQDGRNDAERLERTLAADRKRAKKAAKRLERHQRAQANNPTL